MSAFYPPGSGHTCKYGDADSDSDSGNVSESDCIFLEMPPRANLSMDSDEREMRLDEREGRQSQNENLMAFQRAELATFSNILLQKEILPDRQKFHATPQLAHSEANNEHPLSMDDRERRQTNNERLMMFQRKELVTLTKQGQLRQERLNRREESLKERELTLRAEEVTKSDLAQEKVCAFLMREDAVRDRERGIEFSEQMLETREGALQRREEMIQTREGAVQDREDVMRNIFGS
jgi:hypothetical protein